MKFNSIISLLPHLKANRYTFIGIPLDLKMDYLILYRYISKNKYRSLRDLDYSLKDNSFNSKLSLLGLISRNIV